MFLFWGEKVPLFTFGVLEYARFTKANATFTLKKRNIQLCLKYVITQPLCQYVKQRRFLSRVNLVWIHNFPSPKLVAILKQKKNPDLSYCILIDGGRTGGSVKWNAASSRIWTRIADYVSYNDNFVAKCISISLI